LVSSPENFIQILELLNERTLELEGNCNIWINFVGHCKRDIINWDMKNILLNEEKKISGYAP
jgi:hypothetical protein